MQVILKEGSRTSTEYQINKNPEELMNYISTRGKQKKVSSHIAIKQGIADDRGLFVPESISCGPDEIKSILESNSYQDIAIKILRKFLTDYSEAELNECISAAYNTEKFDDEYIAPIYSIDPKTFVLELFHGPTLAFKDMALMVLPHLMVKALDKSGTNRQIVILVATSGDTGKAALEGFKDVDGISVVVFYPYRGVSRIQELQMTTQEGKNVFPTAVYGNFDDAQTGVKTIFADTDFNKAINESGYEFSSANSINWGRLVPQIVYYFSAYADLMKKGRIASGQKINICVPTGNFGNILAAYYAKKMGLPVNKLICASNENNVLSDFLNTGVYDRLRDLVKTSSPSMDILVSSNLERLLFELSDHDHVLINSLMKDLHNNGLYEVDDRINKQLKELFYGDYCTEEETQIEISKTYKKYGYLIDPHTAVAFNVYGKYKAETGDDTPVLITSTASPFKFNRIVAQALFKSKEILGKDDFDLLELFEEKLDVKVPLSLKKLKHMSVLHGDVCKKADIKEYIKKVLSI